MKNTRHRGVHKATQQSMEWGKKIIPCVVVVFIAFAVGFKASSEGWLLHKASGPTDLDYSSVEKLYDTLRTSYDGQIDSNKLLDGVKKGLVEAAGDPYTAYFTAKESKEFKEALEGKFSGIGAELGKRDGMLVIVSPLEGFPAQKAGLKTGDLIIEVNGEDAAKWSVEQAVSRIRGEKGTTVTLKVARNQQPLEFTITRDDITVPSVEHEIGVDNTGYVQITRFAEDTGPLVKQAAEEFKQKGVKGIVVDLRGNGGGYLQSAVDVASLWINGKVVVEQRQGDKVIESLRGQGQAILEGVPTVVLIDEGSASASEIVAGALQDQGAATLIGAKSFGKGSVQEVKELNGGGELKVTVARWYTPKGKNIDKEGIAPAIEVKREQADTDAGRDPQKDRAFLFIKEGR